MSTAHRLVCPPWCSGHRGGPRPRLLAALAGLLPGTTPRAQFGSHGIAVHRGAEVRIDLEPVPEAFQDRIDGETDRLLVAPVLVEFADGRPPARLLDLAATTALTPADGRRLAVALLRAAELAETTNTPEEPR